MHKIQTSFVLYYFLLIVIGLLIVGYGIYQGNHPVIQIQWTTATEFDTAGFNLYRSEAKEGPYEKINTELIQASDDPLQGGTYTYYDANIVPGRTYWYQLEDVEVNGKTTVHDPIQTRAQRNGILEMIIGGIMILFGVIGIIWEKRAKNISKKGSA
jgi:hypothetical protein